MLTDSEKSRIFDYPYFRPEESYVLDLQSHDYVYRKITLADVKDRVPVLAIGSNSSPHSLSRKFSKNLEKKIEEPEKTLPVTAVELTDFDSALGATVVACGIPATIVDSPGTVLDTHITWVTPKQLAILHRLEDIEDLYRYKHDGSPMNSDLDLFIYNYPAGQDSYQLVEISSHKIRLHDSDIYLPEKILSYATSAGYLKDTDGNPLIFEQYKRINRRFRETTSQQMLAAVAEEFGLNSEKFMVGVLRDAAFRKEVHQWFNEHASTPVTIKWDLQPAELPKR